MLSFGDFVFSKRGFLDDKNVDYFTIVENLAYISKGVKLWCWSKVPNISLAYFSAKKTFVFSIDDVVFLKGCFLDDKNVI